MTSGILVQCDLPSGRLVLSRNPVQWMYPGRVCNLQFTTVFKVLSFSWVYFDRKCFVEKLERQPAQPQPTSCQNRSPAPVSVLPVTTTRLRVFYLAQSTLITTRTTPDPLKCVKMQRRLNTDTLRLAKILNEELQILNYFILRKIYDRKYKFLLSPLWIWYGVNKLSWNRKILKSMISMNNIQIHSSAIRERCNKNKKNSIQMTKRIKTKCLYNYFLS